MITIETKFVKLLRIYAKLSGWFVIILGLIVIAGWTFNFTTLKSILPSFVSMKANTALAFILFGISFLLVQINHSRKLINNIAKVLASIVMSIGLITLLEYLFNLNLGIDQILFKGDAGAILTASPGRMSINTAICFILLGLSLIFYNSRFSNNILPSQSLSLLALIVALISLIGYIYSQWSLLQLFNSTLIALHTAFLFFILSLGILSSQPYDGIMKKITGRNSSSTMLRYLIPAVILLPVVVEFIAEFGSNIGLYNLNLEPFVHTIGVILVLSALIWFSVSRYEQAEIKQKSAEEKSFSSNQILQLVLNSIPQRIFWKDQNLNYLGCNKPFATDAGLLESLDIIGKTDFELSWKANAELYRADDFEVINSNIPKLQYEEPQLQADGKKLWLRTSKAPLHDVNGKSIGVLGTYEDITDAKLTQQKHSTILDTAHDGFWVNDLNGKFIEVNNAFCNMIGYTREELLQMSVNDIEIIEDIDDTRRHIEIVINKGSDSFETKHKRKDGRIIDISVSVNYNKDVSVNQMFVFLRDITESKTTAEYIRLSEAKYRTLTESSPDSIFLLNQKFQIEFVNESACKQFQNSKEKLIGKTLAELFPPNLSAKLKTSVSEVFQSGNPFSSEEKISFPNFDLWLSTTLIPVTDSDGVVIKVLGTSKDITSRKLNEEILLREKEYSEKLIDALPGLFYQISPEGKFTKWNKNFETVSGYSSEEMQKISPLDLFEKEEKNYIAESIQKVFTDGYTTAEANFVSKDGEKTPFYFSGKLINIGEQNFLAGMGLNISDLKQTEEKLRFSESRLVASQSLAQVGFLDWDLVTNDIELSDETIQIYGLNPQNHKPKIDDITKLLHPDDVERVGKSLNDAISGKAKHNVEHRVIRPDGKIVYVRATAELIRDNNNKPVRLLGINQDITQRKQAEIILRDEKQRIRTILDQVGDPIFVKDNDHIITLANSAFYNLFCLDENSVIGYTLAEAVPENERKQFLAVDRKVLDTGIPDQREEELTVNELTRTIITKKTRFIDESGKRFLVGSIYDITERKKAEEVMRESEEKFRNLIKSNPFPLCNVDNNGNLIYINDRFTKDFGYTLEDVPTLDLWWLKAYPDEQYRKWVLETWNSAVEKASIDNTDIESIEYNVTCKDGSVRIIIIAGITLKDGFLATFIDVTDRKKAEEKINRFFNITLDFLCIAGTDGFFKKISPSWTKTFGWSEEEFLTKPFFDFIHPDDIQPTIDAVQKLSAQNPVMNFLNRYKTKDGSYRWLSWVSTPVNETIYASAHDITEIKLAQIQLKISEEKYRNLVDNSPVSLWDEDWTDVIAMIEKVKNDGVTDFTNYFNSHPDFVQEALSKVKILDVNNETLIMFNADDKIQMLESLSVVFSTEDTLPGFIGELIALAEGKLLFETEMALRTVKGDLINTFLRMNFPAKDSASGQVLVSIVNITEIKQAQERLENAMQNLERSNKELEQFAYVASHDLQEPLRMVSSYTQLLGRRYKDKLDTEANDFINFAVDGANRMQRLINDLLDYSRVTTRGKPLEKIDLSSVIGQVIATLQNKIQDVAAMVSNDDLPSVVGDEIQISRVFQNLIDNALKFRRDEPPRIHISSKIEDESLIISISDNGIGINEKFKDRIFTIFQRLHNRDDYPGTGIGLAICKRIVERHGGKIWFESEEGKGTTFYFTLNK